MADFEAVAQKLRDQKPNLSNEQKSEIYGLFKQGSVGDNSVDKPGLMSGFEARGKWDAWEAKKGMSQDDAKQAYVDLVTPLLQ
jgi:diazepam-binding inhibitor (GABA receptor modulator, acyl-CoA-binding protein)